MVTAAKTISQVIIHMAFAFSIAYWFTGSLVFGGLAAMLEPVINVALLPLHQKFWANVRGRLSDAAHRAGLLVAEKISQLGLHMGVAFGVMFWMTGSLAFGGLAAVLEPICNVVFLPFHDRAWEKFRSKLGVQMRYHSIAA